MTKFVRALLIVVPALLASALVLWIPTVVRRAPRSAGEAAFNEANRQIDFNRGQVAFGNSSKAVAVAAEFSRSMKASWKSTIDEPNPGNNSANRRRILIYCELHPSQCIFLVQVPELDRWEAEAKSSLQTVAWTQAQAALRTKDAGTNGMKLVFGLRGMIGYDLILTGRYADDVSSDASRMNSVEFSTELMSGYFEEALMSERSNRLHRGR